MNSVEKRENSEIVTEFDDNLQTVRMKNAPGSGVDEPATSRRDILAQHSRYLTLAGAQMAKGVSIELSPLLTYAGEGLESVKGKTLIKSGIANTVEEITKLL